MPDNAYRQDIVTRIPITQVELITISTVPYEVFGTALRPFFAFGKISAANLRILWLHLLMELRNI